MKKFLMAIIGFVALTASAQMPLRNANPSLTYAIKETKGTNACGVAYDPKTNLYYTAFAGNAEYPLESFDSKGQNKYSGKIGIDVRSIWYNRKTKSLEGYGFRNKGKYAIALNSDGLPSAMKEPQGEYESIPGDQLTACPVKNDLYYFDGSYVYILKASNMKEKKRFTLSNIPGNSKNLNSTTLIYTGVKGYELGFLDTYESKLYFTDLKGNYTGTTLLPSNAPRPSMFRFSYANGLVWLFDADARIWHGYWIFN